VDAKYKLYDEKRLSTADIYQSFFYAYAYNDAVGKQPSALLLYPSSGQRERLNFLQIRGQEWGVKAQLQALSISIPQAISEIKENILGPISQVILEAVGEFLEAEKA
jgi:5-methylcytosine-specific restriction enzyme subunit McrC